MYNYHKTNHRMKIVITLLTSLFVICSCKKNTSIKNLKISFSSEAPILIAQYFVNTDEHEYYYPPIWPNGGVTNFQYNSFEETSSNLYKTHVSVDMSAEYIGIYTKIDTAYLSPGETATYEITIVDQQTGAIKYERKTETTEKYNRELIQL